MTWVATAILGTGVIGAAATAYGANKASDAQQAAAEQAAQLQKQMYEEGRADLAPYRNLGNYSGNLLQSQLPSLIQPINMDQATLEQTPGYQFTKTQGLKAVQNSAAARGLGNSGAALKGAATFATGLADNTYQNQFNNAMANKQFAFNSLLTPTQLGESAAAGSATNAANAGQQIGNDYLASGNAQAAGYNAYGTAANQLSNSALAFGLYNRPTKAV